MHRGAGVIGGREFGVVRRKLWDTDNLAGVTSRRVEKALATYNWVHAKGLIYYGHAVVEP